MQIESFKYSLPYLVLVLFYVLLIVLEVLVNRQETGLKRNRAVIRWLSIGGLLFFFGFRGLIGWDWFHYYPEFEAIPNIFRFSSDVFETSFYNKGFTLYISLSRTLCNNYFFFTFISTLVDLVILNELLKRFSRYYYALACLLFIVMGGFYMETDLIRNAKGIMLFILSIRYIQERKPLPFFLLNIAGLFFHLSSVIYLPMYFILNANIKRNVFVIVFLAGLFITLLQLEYIRPFLAWLAGMLGEDFTELLEKYLEISEYSTSYGLTIGLVERILTTGLVIIYYYRLLDANPDNRIFINSFFIYLIIFFFFSEIKIIPIRVGGLFSYSYWLLYPALLQVIKIKNNRSLVIGFIIIYSLIKIEGMTDNILYRYKNILFGKENYIERKEIFDRSYDTLFN
ncbi:MAG: EpsG family protein [Marinilabiliaceae bacterium]|jgi:hypothetical protein|nr:EpsG family protein [Marinilabiliaceae bacterium]